MLCLTCTAFSGHDNVSWKYIYVSLPHRYEVFNMSRHVTLKNQVIDRSNNFMSGNSLWYVTTLPSLVIIGIVEIFHQGCRKITPDLCTSAEEILQNVQSFPE